MFARWFKSIGRSVRSANRRAPLQDPLCEAILKRFKESAECPGDWPAEWKLAGAPMIRRESTVYRLSSVPFRKSIGIKVFTEESCGKDKSASLYAALRHYHARSDRGRGYTVPEPYGWIPEHEAVIMEWVDGRTFSEILKRDLFSPKRRHENIRKVAGWLRWFHSQSEVEPATPANGRPLKGVVKVFEAARDLDKAATAHDGALRQFIEVASKCSGLLRGVRIDSATLHGDFKATNILISRNGVVGLDFLGRKRGPVSHDICRFLTDLDLYQSLLGRSFALKSGSGPNDFEVFLSAYGGTAGAIDRQAFLYLYHVTILSSLVHQRRKYKRQLLHKVRLAVIRSIARQLSNELSKGLGLTGVKPGDSVVQIGLRAVKPGERDEDSGGA